MATDEDSSKSTTAADASATGDGGDEVTVNIRCSNGSKFTVKTRLDSSVRDFKVIVAQNSDVPAEQQRLIYKGRILKDDHTLTSYGLQADHTIHMVRGFAPSASTTSSGAPNSGTPGHTTTEAAGSAAPTEGGGLGGPGLGSNLFPGLGLGGLGGTGASGLLGAGIPDFEQMQQLNQNPNMMRDMMRDIMNMPAFQSLTNNPDIMRNLIMDNPQMREIIDRNPELAHILNDPSILRQTLETARNPELMREMMRNTDRAMSNIESSPEGFNMLRRMYENVQEPFLNATTMAADSGNNLNSNLLAAVFGTQAATGGQQRDGSNNPSTPGSDPGAPNSNPLPNPWSNPPGGTLTNNARRTTSSGDTRDDPLGGLSSFPELERMFGGVPDLSEASQFMQNPAMSEMMQSLLSNPQIFSQIVNTNPQLRSLTESNPQLREMMQNPEILRQMLSPEMMQQMMTLQQSLFSARNRSTTNQDPLQTGAAAGTANNMGLEMLMNMFGGLGAGGVTTPENSNVPPEERYATQLTQLQEMGFFDTQENIRALQATRGNVNAAVDRLLANLGQ